MALAETFDVYLPSKMRLGREHPVTVLETATMSSVEPCDVYYRLDIPIETIQTGQLSSLQLESITQAGQTHNTLLPSGRRAGFFLGDGVGVGKSRTITGMIYENSLKGRQKAIWITVSRDLRRDVIHDLAEIGATRIYVRELDKFTYDKISTQVGHENGIMFSTYEGLTEESEDKTVKYYTRIRQLLQWCGGRNFEGLLIFDECHKAQNLYSWDTAKFTQIGKTVLKLQKKLPRARVVYASSTGASEPKNMSCMVRLGLWGQPDSAFGSFDDFLTAVETRCVGGPEIVAMDMKLRGMYISRHLSFEDVRFNIEEVLVSKKFRDIYDQSVNLWVEAKEMFTVAANLINFDSNAKQIMWEQFWASHYRFFKYMCIAPKVSRAILLTREAIKNGKSVIISLQSTGEQRTVEELAQFGVEIIDFASTAKDVFQSLVERHFPVPNRKEFSRLLELYHSLSSPLKSSTNYNVNNNSSVATKRKSVENDNDPITKKIKKPSSGSIIRCSESEPQDADDETSEVDNSNDDDYNDNYVARPPRTEIKPFFFAGGIKPIVYPRSHVIKVGNEKEIKATAPSIHMQNELRAAKARMNIKNDTEEAEKATAPSFYIENKAEKATAPSFYIENKAEKATVPSIYVKNGINAAQPRMNIKNDIEEAAEPSFYTEKATAPSFYTENKTEKATVPSIYVKNGINAAQPRINIKNDTEEAAAPSFYTEKAAAPSFYTENKTEEATVPSIYVKNGINAAQPRINIKNDTEEAAEPSVYIKNDTEEAAAPSIYIENQTEEAAQPSITTITMTTTTSDAISAAKAAHKARQEELSQLIDVMKRVRALKGDLLLKIENLGTRLPPNSMDQLIEDLGGPDKVAEISGRRSRPVQNNDGSIHYETQLGLYEHIDWLNTKEKDAFMWFRKKVAIVVEPASGGITLHSNRRLFNKQPRVHITMELPWSVDQATQQLGRTHRTNEVNAPEYIFLITDQASERRLAFTVAKRLESLGALSKHDRRVTGPRALSQFNVDNKYGQQALETAMRSIMGLEVALIPPPADYIGDFLIDLAFGLVNVGIIVNKDTDKLDLVENYNDISLFLNRILGCSLALQNHLFKYFTDNMTAIIHQTKFGIRTDLEIMELGVEAENVTRVSLTRFRRQLATGWVPMDLHLIREDRGLFWDDAQFKQAELYHESEGFYVSHKMRNQRRTVILVVILRTNETSSGSSSSSSSSSGTGSSSGDDSEYPRLRDKRDKHEIMCQVYKPNTGLQQGLRSLYSLEQKYRKARLVEAEPHWLEQYEASADICSHEYWCGHCPNTSMGNECVLGLRLRKYHILTGAVFSVWSRVENILMTYANAMMQAMRIKTINDEILVGFLIPKSCVDLLIDNLYSDSDDMKELHY